MNTYQLRHVANVTTIDKWKQPAPKPTIRGLRCVLVIQAEIKPISGLPEGKHRLRMRNDSVARVFVKTATGIRRFWLENLGETWHGHEEARIERALRRTYCQRGANIRKCLQLHPNILTAA